jgi:ABC-type transport system substrate-binding protein
MSIKKLIVYSITVILIIFSSGCGPAATPLAPAPTITLSPPTSTLLPSDTATATAVPTATPLPGKVVIPITSMANSIPWLPADPPKEPGIQGVFFNVLLPPFDNPLIRQAFAYAIDREEVVKTAIPFWTDVKPASTFTHPLILGRDLYGEIGIFYDPMKARDLLAQAGYTDPSSFPSATLLVKAGGDAPFARKLMADQMVAMWKTNLGVNVTVRTLYSPEFGDVLSNNPPEMYYIGFVAAGFNDPDSFMREIFGTGEVNNFSHFSNAEFDALVEQAKNLKDPEARQNLYIQAESLLCEQEVGVIPLWTYIFIRQ